MSSYDIELLNQKYEPLSTEERIRMLYEDFDWKEVLLTSSFAANSAFFLHLFSNYGHPQQKVNFIDTTYHFTETIKYKEKLTKLYNLNVVDLKPDPEKNKMTLKQKLWEKNPDKCCEINKVEPLNKITGDYKVWASGLMRSQNQHRKNLRVFERKNDIIRFYPIIDITPELRDAYILKHDLHFHPLVFEGYSSIGCKHCTKKGEGREGRWVGLAKTECGLHI